MSVPGRSAPERELVDREPPYGTIVFDCDSTLSAIEGIDELAGAHRSAIAALTKRAMAGELALEAVYGRRLELIRPQRRALDAVAELYARHALPGAAELVRELQGLSKRVVVVSGGLLPAVAPFAARLGIGARDVLAVDMRFDEQGDYADFDQSSPLARSGGKIEVLRSIAAAPGAGAVCFIGDGITDLEAAGEVARFIAFAGFVRREAVVRGALVVCEEADAAALRPLLLSPDELREAARPRTSTEEV